MAPATKHKDPDHAYIVARQERYIEAWRSGSQERVMEFMDKDNFNFSDFSCQQEGLSHSHVKDKFKNTFSNFHDLNIKTRSLHGHKDFTAWEWVIRCKPALGPDGKKLCKEEAPLQKLVGCTLMWWNDKDKIVKNHEYVQAADPDIHHD